MEINWIAEIFDTMVSLLSKWARWMNVRGRRLCFVIWAFVMVYWVVRDLQLKLYSQSFFCGVSFFMNLYGFFYWKKERIGK